MDSLVYVNKLGINVDQEYMYEFYFSSDPEFFWITDADIKPASICNLTVPDKSTYDYVQVLKTDIDLNVAQKNNCFSYQDCKDMVVPVAWENIDEYEENPESGRIVFPFGIGLGDVESILYNRGLNFEI